MSRYTDGDLKGLNRPALLQLVLRQPDVPIPRKLTTQLPTSLNREKLRKLLTGPFGFVKEQIGMPEQGDISGGIVEGEPTGSQDIVMQDQLIEMSSGIEHNGQSNQETTEVPKVRVISPARFHSPGFQLPGELTMDGPDIRHNTASHSQPSTAITLTHIQNSSNATAIDEHGFDSSVRMASGERKLPYSLQATVASLPPDVSTAVQEYFMSNPQEVTAWESICFARNKKKPDFAVIRYIREVLALHHRLKIYSWPTDTGTLRSKDLAKILGFSSPWFTNARHILNEYNRVGPESGRANDAIKARFQGKIANRKGNELLSFLRAQREIIERQTT